MSIAIDVLLPTQAGYPKRLGALGWDSVLHVRGGLDDAAPAIAIVGARAASRSGMDRAHAIAKHVAERGVHVVSGGALGIDGAAHRGALAADGPHGTALQGTTTVVLGSGVDVLYPARHASLFIDVVERGGALVSMFPCGMTPRRSTFLQRNPLIAALADVVIVVEAHVRSGSMSTATAARLQGRALAACPGSPGTNRLLADGAALVETGEDALAALAGTPRYLPEPVLDAETAQVRDAIRAGARGVDSIAQRTGLSVRAVLRALPQLESCLARMQ